MKYGLILSALFVLASPVAAHAGDLSVGSVLDTISDVKHNTDDAAAAAKKAEPAKTAKRTHTTHHAKVPAKQKQSTSAGEDQKPDNVFGERPHKMEL